MATTLDDALAHARTGDVWLFRGTSGADRAIRMLTNAPVNHVGMAVVLDDLPPMMWHAELGRSLPDLWTGTHHRGAQLHDLEAAVRRWAEVYGQQAWLRQLDPVPARNAEDALLRTIAVWDGASFPRTSQLAWRWLRGRSSSMALVRRLRSEFPTTAPDPAGTAAAAYCAELVAVAYEAMGIVEPGRPPNWYDPGRFWSGDDLPLREGWTLSPEIPVEVHGGGVRTTGEAPGMLDRTPRRRGWRRRRRALEDPPTSSR
ncbi:hypothetical protein [Mobilicoccus sp.]|uniref:hypothetical protein n=1 Tax=Mobilicoccus sp. TaxID=2034349 RepID=UPI0028A89E26|nr:hypothetical protein [Mobilicoccus sp.]